MFNRVDAHAPEVHHEIKPAPSAPIDTAHPHEPPTARFVGFIDKFSRRSVAQPLTGFDLLDPSFHGSGQQNLQHVFVIGQKLVSQMTMVNQALLPLGNGDLAKSSLQSDAIRLEILHKSAPPVRFSLDNFAKLRLRNTVSQARFHQHLSTDATTTERLRQCAGEFFAATRCALIDGDDGHVYLLVESDKIAARSIGTAAAVARSPVTWLCWARHRGN